LSIASARGYDESSSRIMKLQYQCLSFACCFSIAACSQVAGPHYAYTPSVSIAAERHSVTQRFRILHSFGKGLDGSDPSAALTEVGGVLYGTTSRGGAYGGGGGNGEVAGTVFRIGMSGTSYRVLHSFGHGSDGSFPGASLLDVKGTLYGTTAAGGAHAPRGTIFSIDTTGEGYRVLYSFGSKTNDAGSPYAGVIAVNGVLYGTTYSGGAYANQGAVFGFDPKTAVETVLHSFGHGSDGRQPADALVNVDGVLYGTTAYGGTYKLGAVFSVRTDGTAYHVLHNFGQSDGSVPVAALTVVKGMLYGTTSYGGAYGCGTVFRLRKSGAGYFLLHSFNCYDGSTPSANVIDVNGVLYSTTASGGAGSGQDVGTIFSMDRATGKETLLLSFDGNKDGGSPAAGLTDVSGTLFGTTVCGGKYGAATCAPYYGPGGTVFALSL
jgi:uncharacterized repeat protein (TIGR03803 family)